MRCFILILLCWYCHEIIVPLALHLDYISYSILFDEVGLKCIDKWEEINSALAILHLGNRHGFDILENTVFQVYFQYNLHPVLMEVQGIHFSIWVGEEKGIEFSTGKLARGK